MHLPKNKKTKKQKQQTNIYIYIYVCVCMCLCTCVRASKYMCLDRVVDPSVAQRFAEAARDDGAGGLERMSTLGAGERRSRHTQRDFFRYSKKISGVRIEPYWVETIARKRSGLASERRPKPILLPHELLAWMYRWSKRRFHEVMGTAEQAFDFWWEIRRHSPTWFVEHPCYAAIMESPEKWLPAKIFGDDARLGKVRAMLAVTLFSAIGSEKRTKYKKLPSFVRNSVDAILGVTDGPLWDANAWSWACLARNEFPAHRHDHKPLDTPWRRKMAGKPILGEFHVALVGLNGDWLWTADTCNLEQSYKSVGNDICHRCGATNTGANNFTNFRDDAPFWPERSNAAYMASANAQAAPVSRTLGFHVLSVWPELMHAGPLGYNLTVAGSVMLELGQEAFWADRPDSGTWQEKLAIQLSAASASFSTWQSDNRRRCSQPRFTVRRLSLTAKCSVPTLKAKAYNSIVVIEWLEHETRKVAEQWPDNSYFRDRATMVWGLANFYRVLRRSGKWMAEDELADLKLARDATLFCFRRLSGIAMEEGSHLYPCRPKMHVFDECHRLAQTTGENPASTWTFQDEDNMRLLVDIAQSCHGATFELATLEKWCCQFFAEEDEP